MTNNILIILVVSVGLILLGYAALAGIITRRTGEKKLSRETIELRAQLVEFMKARDNNRCYFNEYMRKDREAA